ncbi:adenosylcobinamide-GDP ribazoletransferase [Chloroflexales bacterium ZM16-3]|nr:adenosylcobinamide-GDP ribazoletransferase [Chloroflexales bacterium ZM16-3]
MSDQDETPQDGPLAQLDTALRFLTTLPMPWPAPATSGIAKALPFFPLVGAIIGALLVGVGWAAGLWWPPLTQAALLVVAWAVLSGGLHFDGLSDTFDAIMSWRERERKLEIMKDSRIGAMGALAIIGVFLLKLAFLSDAGAGWWRAALVAPMLGRWAMLQAIASFPAARPGGLGSSVQGQIGLPQLLTVSALVMLAATAIAGVGGLCAALLAAAVAHALGRWWTRELGGLTGDTYGAICELIEVVALATITAAN